MSGFYQKINSKKGGVFMKMSKKCLGIIQFSVKM